MRERESEKIESETERLRHEKAGKDRTASPRALERGGGGLSPLLYVPEEHTSMDASMQSQRRTEIVKI